LDVAKGKHSTATAKQRNEKEMAGNAADATKEKNCKNAIKQHKYKTSSLYSN